MQSFEYLIENNPLRARVREIMEVKPLRDATGIGRIERALHIASGNGSATQLLVKHFAPEWLAGIDRDPEAIAAAQAQYAAGQEYSIQSVESLAFEDGSFDAVFDLADLHNLPAWRRGLAEIERVLAPEGLLIMEEISIESFSRGAGKLFRKLSEHDYEAMLSIEELRAEILRLGFELIHFEERNPLGLFPYFLAVARKPG